MKIAILGAGAFGTALGGVLEDNGHDIDYYDTKIGQGRLGDVLVEAGCVVLCVPSVAAPDLLPQLPKGVALLVATKGFLTDKYFNGFDDWMVVSGPGFADDIKARKETYLTVTDERVTEWLKADYLKFDLTDDKRGVLMCGALKNMYAIGAGLLGLERGGSSWREYIMVAAEEMREILAANGAKAATVELVCGIGDLELTCGTPSRNYEYGLNLRDNPKYQSEKTIEGVTVLAKIRRGEIVVPRSAGVLRKLMAESEKWQKTEVDK